MKVILGIAVLATAASLTGWALTDAHAYTKFEVVERVPVEPDPDDPFANTGLFDEESAMETIRRDEFHLGFFPTPQGIFDKHALSVVTLSAPWWLLAIGLAVVRRIRSSANTPKPTDEEGRGASTV